MESFDTLTEAMHGWKKEGYISDFRLEGNQLICNGMGFSISDHEFMIDRFYRFEGESNPSDESILYAISSKKYSLKGLLVSAYGMYSDSNFDEMMKKLDMKS